MNLIKLISNLKHLKNYMPLFLMLFFMNNILVAKAEKDKLHQFDSINSIKYSQYDKFDNQLKIFLGFDSENPETTFYPDLSIINDSEYIRYIYNLKLNDMTINKKNYNIKR